MNVKATFLRGAASLLSLVGYGAFASVELPDPVVWFKMDSVENGVVRDEMDASRTLTLGSGCVASNVQFEVKDLPLGTPLKTVYWDGSTNAWATFPCPALTDRTILFWVYRDACDCEKYPEGATKQPFSFAGISRMDLRAQSVPCTTSVYHTPVFTSQKIANVYKYSGDRTGVASRLKLHLLAYVVRVDSMTESAATGDYELYTDATLTDSSLDGTLPPDLANASTACLGNSGVGKAHASAWHVADFRIYDSVLTTDQMKRIYDDRINEQMRGALIEGWSMDEIVTRESDGARVVKGMNGRADLKLGDAVTVADALDGKALKFAPTDGTIATSWSASEAFDAELRGYTVACWLNVATNFQNDITAPSGDKNAYPYVWLLLGTGTRFMFSWNWKSADCNSIPFYYWNFASTEEFVPDLYPELGCWAHVVFTCEHVENAEGKYNANVRAYVNGVFRKEWTPQQGESALVLTTPNALAKTYRIALGAGNEADSDSNSRALTGLIDDVRVYAGVLTAAEIADVYRKPAVVGAGADFTTASSVTTLRGTVASGAGVLGLNGYAGSPAWSLVSAPEGGAGVVFANASAPVTEVSLPVLGTYVFRLSNVAMGVAATDEVTVVRVAEKAGNQPPTVTLDASMTVPVNAVQGIAATVNDPDAAPGSLRSSWKVVSGPGGAWFDERFAATALVRFDAAGDYVLRCTAEDGQDAASAEITVTVADDTAFDPTTLADGLFTYFKLDNAATNQVVGGETATIANFKAGTHSQHYVPALDGQGYQSVETADGKCESLLLSSTGMNESGVAGQMPDEKWRTISMWVYHDTTLMPDGVHTLSGRVVYNPALVYQQSAFDLTYRVSPRSDGNRGFNLFQAWGQSTWNCPAIDPQNRWMHLVVCMDRRAEADGADSSELWIDGVLQTPASRPSVSQLKSRSNNCNVSIGGPHSASIQSVWHSDYILSDDEYGLTSRTFPGTIDEVRFYNRKLTGAEIRYLATHAKPSEPRAPSVIAPETVRSVARRPTAIAVNVQPDRTLSEQEFTYLWEVISGDATKVSFADATARSTTVTFAKRGNYTLRLAVTGGGRTTYSDPVAVTAKTGGFVISLQ